MDSHRDSDAHLRVVQYEKLDNSHIGESGKSSIKV